MRVFLWIWKLIGPLVLVVGIIYFVFVLFNLDFVDEVPLDTAPTCIIGGICAFVGLILGFTGWAEDVAPRMFWVKSRVDLLDNRIGYSLTMAIQMFFLPAAVGLIIGIIAA